MRRPEFRGLTCFSNLSYTNSVFVTTNSVFVTTNSDLDDKNAGAVLTEKLRAGSVSFHA